MKMNYFLLIFAVVLEVISFSGVPVARAGVYFMTDAGEQRGALGVSDDGKNKGTVVIIGADGKEVMLGGGGSCGTLCAVLTVKIKDNGEAFLAPAVPNVSIGDALMRF